jgi:cyanuric acid amidohydrolase
MAFIVSKVLMEHVQDTDSIEAAVNSEGCSVDDIIALVAKTEGNGGVNDFGRILVDRMLRDFLSQNGTRSRAEAMAVPIALSGGCPGIIAPHINVFMRKTDDQPGDEKRMCVGIAISEKIRPEDIGRLAGVEKVAHGVRLAMKDAGIDDPTDVHYVQTKSPLLTAERIADAKSRGKSVVTEETIESMAISNATAALGAGVAVGEFAMPKEEQIGHDLDLYSALASCSSGTEQDEAQIVVVGNKAGAGGRFSIGHSVMKDAIDTDGIYQAIRNAGLPLSDHPHPSDLGEAVVNCFIKCETDPRGRLRGHRLVSINDTDVHHTHQTKAAVGGAAAAALGDPAVFVSVAALQQGPAGGGMVAAIVDMDKVAGGSD